MTDTVTELARRAFELAPEDRARLAEDLLASLEAEPEPQFDAAWDHALQKRIEDLEAGTAILVPADEVFAGAHRSLR